jgi:regulator of protease activity HflC (stomatin/prohibitin superfamily)
MPQGQIVAHEGEIGVQADTLMPGLYWFNPMIWKVNKVPIIEIGPSEIGIVESVDGEPIPKGRLLADEVDCNHFQDAKMFYKNQGKKGPQVGILRPGIYRINTYAFSVTKTLVTKIPEERIGVVKALDGVPLPTGFIISPLPLDSPDPGHPQVKPHKYFQDGQAFLDSMGYRGPQLDTLQPGQYYVNPLLFKVDIYPVVEVPPGYVAVLRSNVGMELEKQQGAPIPNVGQAGPEKTLKEKPSTQQVDISQPVHEEVESLLITDKNMRGIWKEPVAPGKYNLNPLAFTPYLVPTSAVTIDWASGVDQRTNQPEGTLKTQSAITGEPLTSDEKATEFFKFSQLRVTSMDGFQLEVDVRMIIRIRPQNAAFIIARFGSVKNLIEQIVHPLIDSSFRNKAGEEKAINFIQSRTELQRSALEKAQQQFEFYHVEAQNLLIAYIKVDQALLDTQTKREIALQQQAQYQQEALAQEKRIEVQAKQANADRQPNVIAAMLSVQIAQNEAEARRQASYGERDAIKAVADGNAYQTEQVGLATARAYAAQRDAIGRESTALIKLMQEIGDRNVKITPDFLVTAGGADKDTGVQGVLFSSLLATMFRNNLLYPPAPGSSQATTGTQPSTTDTKQDAGTQKSQGAGTSDSMPEPAPSKKAKP